MTSPYVEDAERRAAIISEQAARRDAMAKARWEELCAASGGELRHLTRLLYDASYEPTTEQSYPDYADGGNRVSYEIDTPSGKRWRVTLKEVTP